MYIDSPLRDYLSDLAARKPAPGGGSAAALTAATGVALMSMVANYTVGNPKYKAVEERAADIVLRSGEFKDDLQDLIDQDVAAYARLSKALKEKAQPLEEEYKAALKPPFEICRICSEAMKICLDLASVGNKNLITDTAIAAVLLDAAFVSAKFNVYINLKYIKDTEYIGKIHGFLAPLEKEMPARKKEILEKCEEVIR